MTPRGFAPAHVLRSFALFALVPLALFLARVYWIVLPLSSELDCGACLVGPQALADWPLFGLMLVLFGISLMVRRAALQSLFRLLVLALGLVYLADIYVYRNFFLRLDLRDVAVYGYQAQLVWGQFVRSLSWPALAGLGLASILALAASLRLRTNPRPAGRGALLLPLAVLALGLLANAADRSVFPNTWILRNVIAHNMQTGVSQPYEPAQVQRLTADLAARAPQCLVGSGMRPNIVVLIAESWSPYHSKLFSKLNDWTPRLDKWASAGRYFTNLHAGGSNTDAGLISILLGHDFYSPIHGPLSLRAFEGLWGLESSLPHLLGANGYQSVFMTNGNLAFSRKGDWMADIGFEQVHGHDAPEYAGRQRLSFDAVADEYLYRKALAFTAAEHERPYLLVLENVSSHHPYTHPHSLERNERKAFEYMDQSMDAFLQRLGQQGFFADNLLVVISDHRAMTRVDPREFELFGLSTGARIPGFVLSGLIEAGEDARPLHQSDLLPSLVALTGGGACAQRPIQNLLHDTATVERCLYHAPNSDWQTVHAYCPQGSTRVKLAGSQSNVAAPGLGSAPADATLLDEVAMRRTSPTVYDIRMQPHSDAVVVRTPPIRPALPDPDAGSAPLTGRSLPQTSIIPGALPRGPSCNIERLDAEPFDGHEVALEPYSDYAISGWVIDEQAHDIAPSAELVVSARDSRQSWLVQNLLRSERPDVVAARAGDSAYTRSGFQALLPVDGLPPGDYELAVVYRSDAQLKACGGGRLRILQASYPEQLASPL